MPLKTPKILQMEEELRAEIAREAAARDKRLQALFENLDLEDKKRLMALLDDNVNDF